MFELREYSGGLCSGKSSYEFLPVKKQDLDLNEIALKLNKKGVFVEVETPFLLMVDFKGAYVTLFKRGRLLLKNVSEKGRAEKIARSLLNALK